LIWISAAEAVADVACLIEPLDEATMATSKKLLCAIDGSRASEKVATFAVDLAKIMNAELVFLTVEMVTPERAAKTYFWDSRLLEAGEAIVHRDLGLAMKKASEAGLSKASCVTTNGRDIAEAIVGYAEAHECDQIIVGSAGRSGIAKLVLGSVAQGVAAKAHEPVTVVR
jgi:nucleotide-binding universal stress UspA family protein